MDEVTPIDSAKVERKKRDRTPSYARKKSGELWARATKAYEMKVSGKLPSEIAEAMDCTEQDVYRMLAERYGHDASYLEGQDRKSILAEELITLHALKAAIWDQAMLGDTKAVDSVVKIIQTQHKIAGLEQIDPVIQKNLVLVMGDKEEDYIAALKATNGD